MKDRIFKIWFVAANYLINMLKGTVLTWTVPFFVQKTWQSRSPLTWKMGAGINFNNNVIGTVLVPVQLFNKQGQK